MQNSNNPTKENLEKIVYQLSKKSEGTSEKLFQFFNISPENYEKVYPITKLQRDIYLDIHIHESTKAYNIGVYSIYDKEFDIDIWITALHALVAKDEAYRTSFVTAKSIICQAVRKMTKPNLHIYDLTSQSLTTEALDTYVQSIINEPYNIYEDVLGRHFVIKLKDNRYAIGIGAHQIMLDGGTGKLYFEQMSSAYDSLLKTGIPMLKETKYTFKEYTFINNESFDVAETINFWKAKLRNCVLPIRNNHSGKETRSVEKITFDNEQFQQLKSFCWTHKITPSFCLRTIFLFVVNEIIADGEDFLTFENKHGRGKDFLDTPGVFLYSEPVTVKSDTFSQKSNFSDWIEYFRQSKKATRKYQNISFSHIIGLIEHDQSLKFFYNYVIYSNVNFINDRLTLRPFESFAPDEVHFFVEQKEDGLLVNLYHSKSHFKCDSFLSIFHNVLTQLLDGHESFQNIQLLSGQERKHLFNELTGEKVAIEDTFLTVFEKQVKYTPENIALVFEKTQWTYASLNKKADQLANYLDANCRVNKGDIVAVALPRSDMYLITLLAIIKVGGVYLPIDPKHPPKRIAYMLTDAVPRVLITVADIAPDYESVLLLDRLEEEVYKGTYNPKTRPSLEDAAYILYTSGSTGKPKGSVIEHMGMINHLQAKVSALHLATDSNVAQNASQSFDISIWQFLAPLITGGTVTIYSDELVHSPKDFIHRVNTDRITVLEVVPSYLQVILTYLDDQAGIGLEHLQFLVSTGESLGINLVKAWFDHFPTIDLVNAYGPTEASDDVTHYIFDRVPESDIVPIGKAIQNTSIYVLNDKGKLCPAGIKGEIYIAGLGIGRGYLNEPEQTHKHFFTDFIQPSKFMDMYRTGDIGAWLPGGDLVYFGRKDDQVKIHGHRIELAEIENLILKSKGVKECVVLCSKDRLGAHRVIAYYCGEGNTNELKENLQTLLPHAMLPSSIVKLDTFPITTNGKIDKKALKKIDQVDHLALFEAPRTKLEQQIQAIWSEVLKKSDIGVHDNFFAIGGHSLNAMQIVELIHEKTSVKIPLKILFQHVTIATLATELETIKHLQGNGIPDADGTKEEFII